MFFFFFFFYFNSSDETLWCSMEDTEYLKFTLRMDYEEGVDYMREQALQGEFNIPLSKRLSISGPAHKGTCDYFLKIDGYDVPSHYKICKEIHEYLEKNNISGEMFREILEDVYYKGTKNLTGEDHIDYLKIVLYWETLQEEIDFPQQEGKLGRKLMFCRYAELASAPFTESLKSQFLRPL